MKKINKNAILSQVLFGSRTPGKNMKVIFLDIDGVLTSIKSSKKNKNWDTFDPSAVALLNEVIKSTGAKIVISSSWSKKHSLQELRQIFKNNKALGNSIIDCTPGSTSGNREEEIETWLRESEHTIQCFIVIDDSPDMGKFSSRLITTSFEKGLTVLERDWAINLLNSGCSK